MNLISFATSFQITLPASVRSFCCSVIKTLSRLDYEKAVCSYHHHRCPWAEHQAHDNPPKEGNILSAAAPERGRQLSKWALPGISDTCWRWTAVRSVEVDLINSLASIWPTPIEMTRGTVNTNISICPEVRVLLCLELPHISAPAFTNNPHSLLHFCLCSDYESLGGEKKVFALQSAFLSLKAVQGKLNMRWYFVKGSVNYLHKTQDVIGCLLLQSDDNPPKYWLFQFPLVFHLTVLSHLVTYLIITIFNDVHHDPVRYWFFRVSVLQWSPNWFSSTLQSPDNSFPHSSLSHLSECNSDLVYSPPVPPLHWEPTAPPSGTCMISSLLPRLSFYPSSPAHWQSVFREHIHFCLWSCCSLFQRTLFPWLSSCLASAYPMVLSQMPSAQKCFPWPAYSLPIPLLSITSLQLFSS